VLTARNDVLWRVGISRSVQRCVLGVAGIITNRSVTCADDDAPELPHATRDPFVNLVEDVAALFHWVANGPSFDRCGIQISQDQHLARPSPEPLTHRSLLHRVHHDDEVSRAYEVGGEQARPMLRQVDSVT